MIDKKILIFFDTLNTTSPAKLPETFVFSASVNGDLSIR